MSNKREREKRREQRIQEESQVSSQDRRTRLLQFGAGAVFLAIVIVVVLIVVASSSSDSGGDAGNIVEAAEVEKLLTGIDQNELTLGDPKAPVELLEFGDLQCPFCKQYAEETLPPIIEGPVRQGQVKITFHNFVIISEESYPAGQAAVAAGEQGRGWNFIEIFYRNQGKEASGYVTEEFMESIAKAAKVSDMAKWNEVRKAKKTREQVEETTSEAANKFHFSGTPSFAIKGPGTNNSIKLLGESEMGSTEALEAAISAAS